MALSRSKTQKIFLAGALSLWVSTSALATVSSPPQVKLHLVNTVESEYTISYPSGAEIQIINEMDMPDQALRDRQKDPTWGASLTCDRPVRLRQYFGNTDSSTVKFQLHLHRMTLHKTVLSPEQFSTGVSCTLTVGKRRVRLLPESIAHPGIHALRSSDPSQAVSTSAQNVRLLKDPYEALNARFRVLLGYDLSRTEYEKKDPGMPIDFSKAPRLDLVIFDTLQIMDDFTGHLILRALAHHARNGAKVTFISSKTLLLPKENRLLRRFRQENPQVEVELYEAGRHQTSDHLHRLHRTNHIKALVTYSASNPRANWLISGGRNQAEMYFYPDEPGNSTYLFNYFDDLDFITQDQELIRRLAQDLLRFHNEQWSEITSGPTALTGTETDKPQYILSRPFQETQDNLSQSYVNLLDSAKHDILVVSPYLNFTRPIAQAFQRAKARGVRIRFITNFTLENDILPFLLDPAMIRAYRPLIDRYEILFYRKKGSTLHVKGLLIDDASLVLGSVNLNQRSFIHDTEFAIRFFDATLVSDFQRTLNESIYPYLQSVKRSELPLTSPVEHLLAPLVDLF